MRAIDADALLQTVSIKYVFGNEINKMKCGELRKILEMIKNAPTVEPPRMRGRWIEDGYNDEKAVCDQCGEPCATYIMGKPRDKYCKWCGADMIENAPTVEPQRMRGKGRWNAYYHGEENGKSIFSYSCNKCGYGAPYNFIGGVCEQKKWNFCPNCGADMRGEQE